MTQLATAPATLEERLIQIGDPRDTHRWRERELNYITRLGLTQQDVPELLRVVKRWFEPDDFPDEDREEVWWASIHAWRALGQLGAIETVPLLLSMLDRMDEREDDWYLEEFPWVLGMIGPPALPQVHAYLNDCSHRLYPRVCAGHAAERIVHSHPSTRDEVVAMLTELLAQYDRNDHTLNAFLVSYLLDLKAAESIEVIERAFKARRVELFVAGNFATVSRELCVPGTGLISEAEANRIAEPPWIQQYRRATAQPPTPTTFKSRKKQKRRAQKHARRRGRKA